MRVRTSSLGIPAMIGAAATLPFMVLELINRPSALGHFPVVLFGFMWLLVAIFVLILSPILRNLRTGHGVIVNPVGVVLRIACLIPIAWLWVGVTLDQMPCFLGVPNCD